MQYMIVLWGFPLLLPVRVKDATTLTVSVRHAWTLSAADSAMLRERRNAHRQFDSDGSDDAVLPQEYVLG